MEDMRSFTDFQRSTGIARNTLADRLGKLTARGILTQVRAPSGKRKHYLLTKAGLDLFTVIVALRQWGERHAFTTGEPHSVLVDDQGARIPALHPMTSRGVPAASDTTSVLRKLQEPR